LRVIGNADAAGFRNPFETCRDIDAVAEDIVVVKDDVADVNADPELDPHLRRNIGVLPGHGALDLERATRRIDRAGEFHQQAVAGGLDDTAAMRGDRWIDKHLSQRFQVGQRAFFVAAHQTAVAGDIRRQHGRQPSFHALTVQKCPLDRCPLTYWT
jgi:hypothetical protein